MIDSLDVLRIIKIEFNLFIYSENHEKTFNLFSCTISPLGL